MNTKIDPKKIVLGTAQLGSNYGVMNRNNKNDRKNINLILEKAWEYGIRCFDTAPGYKSERLIGDFVKAHGLNDDIKVLTKVSSLNSINIGKEISKSIEISIKNLNCPISVLFLHDPDDAKLLLKHQDMFIRLMEYFEIKDIEEQDELDNLSKSK